LPPYNPAPSDIKDVVVYFSEHGRSDISFLLFKDRVLYPTVTERAVEDFICPTKKLTEMSCVRNL